MSKLGFALIDAKDFAIVHIEGSEWGMANNEHNAKVLSQARVDYLKGLSELQRRIRSKHEPQLIDNTPVEGEDPKGIFYEEQEELIGVDIQRLMYH